MSIRRRNNVLLEPVMVSSAMRRLDRTLRRIVDKDVVVCLVGESGTGKEVLARRIHELSSRRAERFVPINCAAIPETLFESELFGHERGAFTGASELMRGKVEAAAGGTLFLDEIGELPIGMQAKLLRFLENLHFMRVGGIEKILADVRLICATLRPLEDEVRKGSFRADLYYRIQGITLSIPPLRERRADITPLASELTAQLATKHAVSAPKLTRAALAAFQNYAWPGNIRELRNVLEELCLLRPGRAIRLADLPAALRSAGAGGGPVVPVPHTLEISLDEPLEHSVDRIVQAAVALEGGNRSRAAERLRIGLRTVQRKLSTSGARAIKSATSPSAKRAPSTTQRSPDTR
jgi:transcriptional regulator with PAS, ATPase and Fis domain